MNAIVFRAALSVRYGNFGGVEQGGDGFVLETERLYVRQMRESDLDAVAEMRADPEVMRYWPTTYSRDESLAWIRRHLQRYQEDGYGYWLAERKADGVAVAQLGLMKQEFAGRVEVGLGYIVHRPYWRMGYAFEGAQASLQYGFNCLGLERIAVLIRPENEPSIQLAKKLGAKFEFETEYAGYVHAVYWVQRHEQR